MKNSNETIKKRHTDIIKLLREKTTLHVPELATLLAVSEITIRRDLNTLDKMGMVVKFHGGASIVVTETTEIEKTNDKIESIKHAIAKVAASFVKEGDTIFVNTSSTALSSLKYLGDKRVNVITNNVKVANIDHNPNSTIILSGGEIRFPKEALVGDIAINTFSKMTANISIIGCSGIDSEEGITTPIMHEAKINSLIIERTQGLKIVVADYRKIGKTTNFISANWSDISYLITDTFADSKILQAIEKKGVLIIQVNV